jgi:hypothetical protein
MSQKTSNRRAYGTGTLYVQERANGQELWYGRCISVDGGSTAAWGPSADVGPARASTAPKPRPSCGS